MRTSFGSSFVPKAKSSSIGGVGKPALGDEDDGAAGVLDDALLDEEADAAATFGIGGKAALDAEASFGALRFGAGTASVIADDLAIAVDVALGAAPDPPDAETAFGGGSNAALEAEDDGLKSVACAVPFG